jgi:N-acyl-phosphatidylethanolamine-hydrolysing phospholipase D
MIGRDVGARTLITSHWGTISSLSDEPMFEPPMRFQKSANEGGVSLDKAWSMKVSETKLRPPTYSK